MSLLTILTVAQGGQLILNLARTYNSDEDATRKTVEGAGALMEGSDEDAATLRRNVTSPNGVTQAALEVLMSPDAMPSIFETAIGAAIARDEALSKETE